MKTNKLKDTLLIILCNALCLVFLIIAITMANIFALDSKHCSDVSEYYIKVNESYERAPKEYNSVYEYYEKVSYDFYNKVEKPKQEDYGIYYISLEDGEYKKAKDYYKVITDGTIYYTKEVEYYYIPIVPDTSSNPFSEKNLQNTIYSKRFWLQVIGQSLLCLVAFFGPYSLITYKTIYKRVNEQEFVDLATNYNNHIKKKETDSFAKFVEKTNFDRKRKHIKSIVISN